MIEKKKFNVEYANNNTNSLKVDFKSSTIAGPAPSCGGVGYWTLEVVTPGWDIPVIVDEEWIWDSECFCCSSASLLSGQSLIYRT